MADRPLPQNLEAERGLLGVLMDRNDMLFEVSGLLDKADFIETAHGDLYLLMRDMIEKGEDAKPSTLMFDMGQNADIGGITAIEYMNLLLREAPDASVAKTFAKTIHDLALRRRLIAVIEAHRDEAFSAPATISAAEIESRYHAAASTLFSRVQDLGVRPLAEIGRAVLEQTQAALSSGASRGHSSGLKALDDLWGPLLPGRLHCISGASGSGKTALAYQIGRHVAASDPVLVQSIEMDGEELATRDISTWSGISGPTIERAAMNPDEFERMIAAQETQRDVKLYIDSGKRPTVGSIRGKAMRMKRMTGLSGLIIDHLRYIRPANPKQDLFEGQHDILQELNAVADDLGIWIILLCQMRAGYGGEPKVREPNVGDIFNSGVVEQESDALLIVHREEFMLARRKPSEDKDVPEWEERMLKARGKATLLLQKRRGGGGYGRREIGFEAERTLFTDMLPKFDFARDFR